VETFLCAHEPVAYFLDKTNNPRTWFPADEAAGLREMIRTVIERMRAGDAAEADERREQALLSHPDDGGGAGAAAAQPAASQPAPPPPSVPPPAPLLHLSSDSEASKELEVRSQEVPAAAPDEADAPRRRAKRDELPMDQIVYGKRQR
jgi:hypothetical protein